MGNEILFFEMLIPNWGNEITDIKKFADFEIIH